MPVGNLDPQTVTIIVVIAALCIGGLILSFILPIISGIFGVFSNFIEIFIDVLTGGPVAWCGCILLLLFLVGFCGFIAVMAYSLSTCGTPDAVRFCTWFGL